MGPDDDSFAVHVLDRRVHVAKDAFEVIERSGGSFFRRRI
jgi:hypothetical protein